MKKFIFILLLLNSFGYSAQMVFYQDIFHGGVTGSGYSPYSGGAPFSGIINVGSIPIGSVIEKAYLFAFRLGKLNPITIQFNSNDFLLDASNLAVSGFNTTVYGGQSGIHVIDVKNLISTGQLSYSISTSDFQSAPENRFSDFYLLIVYSNSLLSKMSCVSLLNNQDLKPQMTYQFLNINTIDLLSDVGLSLSSGYICNDSLDGETAYVNGMLIGDFGGNNPNSGSCGGPFGSFQYENNVFSGLNGCNPSIAFNSFDVIKRINSELTSTNSINLDYKSNTTGNYTNNIWENFLTYTTSCDTFSVNLLTEDTTICKGTSVQLGAFSVNPTAKYEWFPTSGLSCSTCANPVASPDSTTYYTVRVWNTDSCSKVLPVRVKVLPQPQFTSIALTPTTCGVSTGSISTSSMAGISTDSLFIDSLFSGIEPQNTTHLGAGNYTLYLIDTNSCKSKDTTVTINSNNLATALFTLNPTTGAVPLAVSSDNQSTHATDYNWYFQNDSSNNFSPSFEFDTAGTYTITLVAYNNTPNCSDTFSLQVVVYDSLQIIVPNVFTPNGDNQNDVFSIQVNAPCTGTITLTNRWGNVILTKDIEVDGKEQVQVWNGISASSTTGSINNNSKASDGVYFYILSLRDKKGKDYRFQGFVELVK